MNQEDIISYYNTKLEEAQAQNNIANLNAAQSHVQLPEPDVNLIKEQLDLGPELQRIDRLLRGFTLAYDERGKGSWVKPTDENMIVLSDYGVHFFREILSWYVNKNHLLSNYETEQILNKMLRVTKYINDSVYLNYEKIFLMPSVEACTIELERRLKRRAEMKQYARKLLGINVEVEEIREELIKEMEIKLEEELNKIRDELFSAKLKKFKMILRAVQDTIHSTYQRAWNGQERRSLRQSMSITEARGGFGFQPEMQSNKKGGLLGMFRRK